MLGINNFYNLNPTELSGAVIIFNLLLAFILQLVVIYVYKKTRHGLSHSQSFIFTLIMIGTLGAAIMMAVQNNIIGAFAIFGAFTLIRFRSILKETSDLAYVFFSLVVGISVGMNHYALALLTTVFLSIVIYVFHRFGFGNVSDNFDYLLIVRTQGAIDVSSLEKYIEEKTTSRELLHVKHFDNQQSEYAYSLRLNDTSDVSSIGSYVKKQSAVTDVHLITGKNTSEF